MTSHELARKLLEGEDLPVCTNAGDSRKFELSLVEEREEDYIDDMSVHQRTAKIIYLW